MRQTLLTNLDHLRGHSILDSTPLGGGGHYLYTHTYLFSFIQ